jgi:hypothetical protein
LSGSHFQASGFAGGLVTLPIVFNVIFLLKRYTRNAIVHNIPTSFQKYRTIVRNNYGQVGVAPHEILFHRNLSTGKTIYEDWCDDLIQAISAI